MFLRLARLLFGNPEDIDLEPALGRMSPMEIHPYSAEDFEACRELYVLNEPNRFPPGILPAFEASLRTGDCLFLVARKNGELCGCAGISIKVEPVASIAWLCYGLIHPRHQGQGLGAAMLLARLSLLPADVRWAAMSTVPGSRGYYERFNFRECVRGKWPDGSEAPIHRVRLPSRTRTRCAYFLKSAGVTMASSSLQVPASAGQQEAAPVS